MTTGFLYDPIYLKHRAGRFHPESPLRLERTYQHLSSLPWFPSLQILSPRQAEDEWLRLVHSAGYLLHARETCARQEAFLDTQDVGICPDSYDVAVLAAGGALMLADSMMRGDIQNGFALLRPPGHHAEENQAMGFCLLNNIAILARYLQRKHDLEKILILDWDVHHGNGTQHIFYEDPSVFYISLHQFPFYPGTGAFGETGRGRGEGATLNCPMPAGCGNQDYEKAFQTQILPVINRFKPDAILISAGFDAHTEDPLGSMQLSTEFFGWMTQRMLEMAAQHCQGRLLSLLEGGYNLRALAACTAIHLEGLLRASE